MLTGLLGSLVAILGLVLSIIIGAPVLRFLIAGSIAICGNLLGLIIASLSIDLSSDPQAAVGAFMLMAMLSIGTIVLYVISLFVVFQFGEPRRERS